MALWHGIECKKNPKQCISAKQSPIVFLLEQKEKEIKQRMAKQRQNSGNAKSF